MHRIYFPERISTLLNYKNFINLFFFISISLFLIGCSSKESDKYSLSKGSWQEFSARDDDPLLIRPLIYRAFVPFEWERKDASPNKSIKDTFIPICEYFIPDPEEKIRLTIHTFPFSDSTTRIPCRAQISRWKNQFQEIDSLFSYTTQESHGGFCGFKLEAQGIFDDKKCKMLAWSMQLAQEHESRLNKIEVDKYKLADYTIKVIGTPSLVEKHKKEIQNFADSFEFIEELQTTL